MKKIAILGLALLTVTLGACKKENSLQVNEKQTTQANTLPDSVSFSVDGKQYIATDPGEQGAGNAEANRKLDSVNLKTSTKYISVDKDSIQFYRNKSYLSVDKAPFANFEIYFIKNYAKTATVSDSFIRYPKNYDDMFKSGDQPFATDFTRNNSRNGVALTVMLDGGVYNSYVSKFLGTSTTLDYNTMQNGSSFKIISVKKNGPYTYQIEARFKLNVYSADEATQLKITDGYLRISSNGIVF